MITSAAIAPIFFSSMRALWTLLPARAKTVDSGQCQQRGGCYGAFVPSYACERAKYAANHRDCGHAAGLRNQKQSPSIHEGGRRMIGFAQVDVLTTCCAGGRRVASSVQMNAPHFASEPPSTQRRESKMACACGALLRKDWRNSRRRDDPAHHDHRRVKQPKLMARF